MIKNRDWLTNTYHIKQQHCVPNYHLTLHYQLCSTCYTEVRINNCLKRTFAIKVDTMKIMDDVYYEYKPTTKSTLLWWKEGTVNSMKTPLYAQ